ncbi:MULTISPECIES: hypothetical protein [unclassified Carboxylicivirga]|uniref:hypothetical protein n=1 Tax=Carboxylicivirga TaxID=1628153 RepID=UPI003D338BB8
MIRCWAHNCKDISDKIFIFDIFQKKGFVDNVDNFLKSGNLGESPNDCETDDQHSCIDNEG